MLYVDLLFAKGGEELVLRCLLLLRMVSADDI